MQVTISVVNKMGIACEKTVATVRYKYNNPLPIEWTYSAPFPQLFRTKKHKAMNHRLFHRCFVFLVGGKSLEKVRNRSIQSVVDYYIYI